MNSARDKTPVILSALVYPGAGQFLQRRWGPAIFFVVTFSVLLYLFFREIITPIFSNWDVVFRWAEMQENRPFQPIAVNRVLLLFFLLVIVYIASLADVSHVRRQPRHPPPLSPEIKN